MKFYKDICLLFSNILTSYASYKYNRNNYDLLKCTSIYFFKLMRWIDYMEKCLSRQSGIPAVQKRDPVLPGRNFLHVIARYNLWRIYNTAGIPAKRDRNSILANWDHIITTSQVFSSLLNSSRSLYWFLLAWAFSKNLFYESEQCHDNWYF